MLKTEFSEKTVSFYIFANVFIAWYNRRDLGSHTCVCIQWKGGLGGSPSSLVWGSK